MAEIKRILVPIDGSENARRAQARAITLARAYSASLVFVNVVSTRITGGTLASVDFEDAMQESGEALVEKAAAEARAAGLKATGMVIREPGSAVGGIMTAAESEGADLIVIGTRGRGGFSRLLLGSVASGVVSHASCSVLVVR